MANKTQDLYLGLFLVSGLLLLLITLVAKTKMTIEGNFKAGING